MGRLGMIVLLVGLASACQLGIRTPAPVPPDAPGAAVTSAWWNSLTEAPPLTWTRAANTDYEVSIGTHAGETDVLPWTLYGNASQTASQSLSLNPWGTYYWNLRVIDAKGTPSAAVSSNAWRAIASGVFASTVSYAVPAAGGNGPRSVVLGDVDRDGDLDLLTSGNNNQVSYFRNAGDGTFGSRADLANGDSGQALSLGDVDHDGWLDLFVTCFSTHADLFVNTGAGTYSARTDFNHSVNETAGVLADLNGDGYVDQITAAYSEHGVAVRLNQVGTPGTFGVRVVTSLTTDTAAAPAQPKDLEVADVNGDGKLDVIVSIESSTGPNANAIVVLLGNGAGGFAPKVVSTVTGASALREIAIGDFDRDGKLDLTVASYNTNQMFVLMGGGSGMFSMKSVLAAGTNPHGAAVADLNHDGFPDVMTVNAGTNTLGFFLGRGDGTFSAQSTTSVGTYPLRIATGDLNGDGRPDAVVSQRGSDSVGVLLMNPGL